MNKNTTKKIALDGSTLTVEIVNLVANDTLREYFVYIKPSVIKRINKTRAYVDSIVSLSGSDKETPYIYGINTGFGANKHKYIDGNYEEKLSRLSFNLIASHASGAGEKFPREVVRAALLLRANTLVKGYSGIRLEVIQRLLDLLNEDITPVVPSQGSVGGSGDLAPLSHAIAPLLINPYDGSTLPAFVERRKAGSASAQYEIMPADKGLAPVERVTLKAKEGLALNNGTQFLTGMTSLGASLAEQLVQFSTIATAVTAEAMLSTVDAYNPLVHELRGFTGQIKTAEAIRKLIAGSSCMFNPRSAYDYTLYRKDVEVQQLEISLNQRKKIVPVKESIQDNYSIRCAPQVIGAVWDTVQYVKSIVNREANSVNDNPIINTDFPADRLNGKGLSGGNFHGEPIAFAADFLKIALAELGSVAERRIAALLDPSFNRGLPAFLSPELAPDGSKENGLHSGFMIAQYLAAGLVAENKILAHPASVDSIPTSNGIEDHVSMGTHGAKQALQIAENTAKIIGIEMLVASQALHLRTSQNHMHLYDVDHRRNVLQTLLKTYNQPEVAEGLEKLEVIEKLLKQSQSVLKPGKAVAEAVKLFTEQLDMPLPITFDVYLNPYLEQAARIAKDAGFTQQVNKNSKISW
ncbi:MAG: aromatic amino acid lyase [Ignavibacteriales bacterium]|nr:aromatic amino acid lyase [Ignavibacteriales bacterium]